MTGASDPPRGERPAPTPRERPRVFGDYHLLGVLAEGGMGAIHLARRAGPNPALQPFCVVKRLHKDLARQTAFLRRFQDEARVVVTLRHPALAHVFDVGCVDDEHFLAMELVEGVSLRELADAAIAAGERLDPGVALAIVDDVLDALGYAHERKDAITGRPLQIVHRDVSPQNVMLTFQGTTKLIDFGVVKSALRADRTVGGVVVGKLGYMSPEQGRGEAVDARTDVYATAIMLWELLAGRRFYGELPRNRIVFELNEGTWQPSYDAIPDALRAPLRHALAAEAPDRTPSAAAFAAALGDAAKAAGIALASHRARRALVQRLCGDAETRLQVRLRAAHDIRPEPPREPTRVTTHARSDGPDAEASSSRPTMSLAPPPTASHAPPTTAEQLDDDERLAREPTRILAPTPTITMSANDNRRRAAFAGVVGGLAIVAVAVAVVAVVVAGRRSEAPPSPAAVAPAIAAAGAVAPVIFERVVDAGPAAAPAVVDAGPAAEHGAEHAVVDAAADAPTTKKKPTPAKRPPPAGPLPDLGAQLDYLARWCVGRVACARAVVDARARIPLLDAAGLTALRDGAARCVASCRR